MTFVLGLIVFLMAVWTVFQAIGSCADDVRSRPGMALARVVLAFLCQTITVTLAVLLGRGV